MVASPIRRAHTEARRWRTLTGLQECPRCQRHYLDTDPATGSRYCLYAVDCGYSDQPMPQAHGAIVYEVTG